jgi:hypothetical protein
MGNPEHDGFVRQLAYGLAGISRDPVDSLAKAATRRADTFASVQAGRPANPPRGSLQAMPIKGSFRQRGDAKAAANVKVRGLSA